MIRRGTKQRKQAIAELERHFTRLKATAHAHVAALRSDPLDITMEERVRIFRENVARLGRPVVD